ncbi:hypothetical protein [Acidisoma sp. C75]
MDTERLRDRFSYGLGKAALATGEDYTLLRPTGAIDPTDPLNKKLLLKVSLAGQGQGWRPAPAPNEPFWSAMMDTAYTRPGDYLRGPLGIFFIAAQPPLLPTLCVQTNRAISVTRPDGAAAVGINGYGGVQSSEMMLLLQNWPASVLMGRTGGRRGGELPDEPGPPLWTVLLPPLPQQVCLTMLPGDILSDETGFSAVITAVEPNALGWRIAAVEAIA